MNSSVFKHIVLLSNLLLATFLYLLQLCKLHFWSSFFNFDYHTPDVGQKCGRPNIWIYLIWANIGLCIYNAKKIGSGTRIKSWCLSSYSWYKKYILLSYNLSSLCPELFCTFTLCLTVDLCRPMLVGLLLEDVERDRKRASEPLFLRVRQGHLLEVDMHQGCVKTQVELDSLQDVIATEATCTVEVRLHIFCS